MNETLEPVLPPIERVVFFDMETTGFDPFVDKIITVQIRYRGRTRIWKEWELGEPKCIEEFFDFLETIYRRETSFVGYNLLKFDVAFIDERLRLLGVMNKEKWQTLHSYLHWVDLYQLLGNAYFKAKHWYGAMAGAKQETENKEVPLLYQNKNYEKILTYIDGEMKDMETIYQGLLKEPFYKELVRKQNKLSLRFSLRNIAYSRLRGSCFSEHSLHSANRNVVPLSPLLRLPVSYNHNDTCNGLDFGFKTND